MNLSFDVISDLNLSYKSDFVWDDKVTSTTCIIAGNISSDILIIKNTLLYLKKFYKTILYIPGILEYSNTYDIPKRNLELFKLCNSISGVTFLYNYVIVINGIAFVGAVGWEYKSENEEISNLYHHLRNNDINYLEDTISKLQIHGDVKKIVIVTHSSPSDDLYFGEHRELTHLSNPLSQVLSMDTEQKVSHWVYGNFHKHVDINKHDIHFICNSYYERSNYYPKVIKFN